MLFKIHDLTLCRDKESVQKYITVAYPAKVTGEPLLVLYDVSEPALVTKVHGKEREAFRNL